MTNRPINILVLTNTRQSERIARHVPGTEPDPKREYRILAAHGVNQVLRDCGAFPANPLAGRHVTLAGLDPLRALRILLFDRDVDLVFCVYESTPFFLLALRRLLFFRPPIVLQEVNPRGWKLRDIVLDFVLPRVDGVAALTQAQADYVAATWRLKQPPEVMNSPVDEEFYAPAPAPERGYILAVGKDFSRDFATLIAACAALDCELVLKTPRRVSIPDAMAHRVRLLAGDMPATALRDLYAGAAIVVVPLIPSDNPGGISTVLEAMAMGRPVIVSDTGTMRSVAAENETAFFVPPRDVPALTAALRRLLDDPALAARLGAAGRASVEATYGMAPRFARLAAYLRRCAGAPPWT